MVSADESALRTYFTEIHEELLEWGKFVDRELSSIAKSVCGDVVEKIQMGANCRIKDTDSFIQKALYRNKNYENPIMDITDKVGTRLVLLSISDVKSVSEIINTDTNWIVIEQSQDIGNIRLQNPEVFTYQSNHFIVKPKDDYGTKINLDLLTCEIQVRTLMEHAYAETSHATVYKHHSEDNPALLRLLATLMAFFETADDKIQDIFKMAGKDVKQIVSELLISEYISFVNNFKESKYDAEMSFALFDVLKNHMEEINKELPKFIVDNREDIEMILDNEKGKTIFSQPIFILIYFALNKWRQTTIENWPYTYDSLTDILISMGISDDVRS